MRCALRFLQAVSVCAAALMILAAISIGTLHAQDARPIPGPSAAPRGIPEDWSNRHVVYTRNGSFEDMVKVRDDPRFINSVRRWKMQEQLSQTKPLNDEKSVGLSKGKSSKVDWALSLGHRAGMAIGESPAKYTYITATTPSCNDFAVYTIDTPRVAAGVQGNLYGVTNLYSGTGPGICGTAPTTLFSYAIARKTGRNRDYRRPRRNASRPTRRPLRRPARGDEMVRTLAAGCHALRRRSGNGFGHREKEILRA